MCASMTESVRAWSYVQLLQLGARTPLYVSVAGKKRFGGTGQGRPMVCTCMFSEMGGNNRDMSVQANASTRGTARERDVWVATGWNGVSN